MHAIKSVDPPNRCRACGHDLGTLADSAACPECATPAALSRASHRFADADPEWSRSVRRGLRIFSWGLWTLVGVLFAVALSLIVAIVVPTWFASVSVASIRYSFLMGAAAGATLCAAGLVLATLTDPRDRELGSSFRRVVLLRGSIAIAGLGGMGLASGLSRAYPQVQVLLLGVLVLGVAGSIFVGLRALALLADRIPAPDSASLFRGIAINGGGLTLVALATYFLAFGSLQALVSLPTVLLAWYVLRTALELPSVLRRLNSAKSA